MRTCARALSEAIPLFSSTTTKSPFSLSTVRKSMYPTPVWY
jgi:hypothetical protein